MFSLPLPCFPRFVVCLLAVARFNPLFLPLAPVRHRLSELPSLSATFLRVSRSHQHRYQPSLTPAATDDMDRTVMGPEISPCCVDYQSKSFLRESNNLGYQRPLNITKRIVKMRLRFNTKNANCWNKKKENDQNS